MSIVKKAEDISLCIFRLFQKSPGSQLPLPFQLGFSVSWKVCPAWVRAAGTGAWTVIAVYAVIQTYVTVMAACFVALGKCKLNLSHLLSLFRPLVLSILFCFAVHHIFRCIISALGRQCSFFNYILSMIMQQDKCEKGTVDYSFVCIESRYSTLFCRCFSIALRRLSERL